MPTPPESKSSARQARRDHGLGPADINSLNWARKPPHVTWSFVTWQWDSKQKVATAHCGPWKPPPASGKPLASQEVDRRPREHPTDCCKTCFSMKLVIPFGREFGRTFNIKRLRMDADGNPTAFPHGMESYFSCSMIANRFPDKKHTWLWRNSNAQTDTASKTCTPGPKVRDTQMLPLIRRGLGVSV